MSGRAGTRGAGRGGAGRGGAGRGGAAAAGAAAVAGAAGAAAAVGAAVPPIVVQPVQAVVAAAGAAAAVGAAVPPIVVLPVQAPLPPVVVAAAMQPAQPLDAFGLLLHRLGFTPQTVGYMANVEGLTSMQELARHPSVSLNRYVDDMSKTYGAAFVKTTPPTVLWPASAKRRLLELRAWMDYRQARGESLDVAAYTDAVATQWMDRLNEMEIRAATTVQPARAPAEFLVLADWRVWSGNFIGYLSLFRNAVTGVKLTYLLRENLEVTDAARAAAYPTIDDDLYATTIINERTLVDDEVLWEHLRTFITNGLAWPHIMNLALPQFTNTGRGRMAWFRLVTQLDGAGQVYQRKAEAYAMIHRAVYTGKGKFTFPRYVLQHTEAHQMLMAAGVPTDQQLLVADFISGIKDERLNQVTAAVYSDRNKYLNDFVATQQFYSEFVAQMNVQGGTGAGRQINGLGRDGSGDGDGKKRTRGKRKVAVVTTTGVEDRKYSPGDYKKLTSAQKTELDSLRKARKKKEKKAAGKKEKKPAAEERSVSSVARMPAPDPMETEDEDSEPDEPAPKKRAPDDSDDGDLFSSDEEVPMKDKKPAAKPSSSDFQFGRHTYGCSRKSGFDSNGKFMMDKRPDFSKEPKGTTKPAPKAPPPGPHNSPDSEVRRLAWQKQQGEASIARLKKKRAEAKAKGVTFVEPRMDSWDMVNMVQYQARVREEKAAAKAAKEKAATETEAVALAQAEPADDSSDDSSDDE